jgi:hypothetical protein
MRVKNKVDAFFKALDKPKNLLVVTLVVGAASAVVGVALQLVIVGLLWGK